MADNVRLSLALPTEPRDSTLDKDSLTKNAFLEQSKSDVTFTRKRPGFILGTEGVTTGNNRGIFFHNNVVWVVTSGNGLTGYVPETDAFGFYYLVISNEDFV